MIKIHSGGQNGADLAGLVAAYDLKIETGGWCPKNCRVCNFEGENDSNIDLVIKYNLKPHASYSYAPRTILNVKETDATIWFGYKDSPGGKLTISSCKKFDKKYLINPSSEDILEFVNNEKINILNIAGNRESKFNLNIYADTYNKVYNFLKLYIENKEKGDTNDN